MYLSSAPCAHVLDPYEVWPLPLRVSKTEFGIWLLTACAHAYGVAGSLVPPTSRIGGAPSAVIGPTAPVGFTGQYAQARFEYWVGGPKNGDALANAGPSASYAPTSGGTGRSRQLTA